MGGSKHGPRVVDDVESDREGQELTDGRFVSYGMEL